MKEYPEPLDLKRVRVYPLAQRESLSELSKLVVDPAGPPRPCGQETGAAITDCARQIKEARNRGANVMLIYGAHLIKNGGMSIVNRLIEQGWVTHLATNGAG